jgi:hypothetical protein
MLDRHRLQRAEMEQRLEALLAAVAGALDASKGQLDAATGAEIIDEDLAGFERLGEAELAPAVARIDDRDRLASRRRQPVAADQGGIFAGPCRGLARGLAHGGSPS